MVIFVSLCALGFFGYRRLLRYLRYLQQEDYETSRFLKWLVKASAWDIKGSASCLVAAMISIVAPEAGGLCGAFLLLAVALLEENPLHTGKVVLKLTARARRILWASTVFFVLLVMGSSLFGVGAAFWFFQMGIVQALPFLLTAGVWVLGPNERARQKVFIQEAREKLSRVKPCVIGITGSYGKTGTKNALGQLLQVACGATFWPGKSINTEMGITREIREKLVPGYKYAVIEMAAYYQGSIARLCRLTPPQAAIITSVGSAHLERFGSRESIYRAKSELAQAVPRSGILVCNGSDPGALRMSQEYPKDITLLYGFTSPSQQMDCEIVSLETHLTGTRFHIRWQGKDFFGETGLYGRTALLNAVGAFTMACALGADPALALAVMRNLEPVDNRLQIKKERGVLVIRDAYNSNPQGFASALQVLRELPLKRKVLMTPGMIELGETQYAENKNIGRMAAEICDRAILVGQTNRDSLVEGFAEAGFNRDHLVLCETRQEAFECLTALQREGDGVLIENDLTDLYDVPARF